MRLLGEVILFPFLNRIAHEKFGLQHAFLYHRLFTEATPNLLKITDHAHRTWFDEDPLEGVKKPYSYFISKSLRNVDEITSPTMHHSFRPPLPDLKSQKHQNSLLFHLVTPFFLLRTNSCSYGKNNKQCCKKSH